MPASIDAQEYGYSRMEGFRDRASRSHRRGGGNIGVAGRICGCGRGRQNQMDGADGEPVAFAMIIISETHVVRTKNELCRVFKTMI